MDIHQAQPAPATLRVEGEMTIYRAHELKGMLLPAAASRDVLELDLSGVSDIDSAGLQLLMLAKKVSRLRQRSMRIVAHSPAVVEAFELLDLAGYFGDPLVIPAAA